MKMNMVTFLTVLTDGRVDLTVHELTPKGRVRKSGQRITIAPWSQVLAMISPSDDCRVVVRAE